MIDPKKAIVFDADVIIHFDKANMLYHLKSIFPKNRKIILDKVAAELKNSSLKQALIYLVDQFKVLEVIPFPTKNEVKLEYATLAQTRGPGESACMAYCKFSEDIIASSNLKDIQAYCEKHQIQYLTTMDFVYEAYVTSYWDEATCEEFVKDVISKGSKLPCKSFAEYLLMDKHKSGIK